MPPASPIRQSAIHRIDIFDQYEAVRLTLIEYPQTPEEVAAITHEMRERYRCFIGRWQGWFDFSTLSAPIGLSAFAASKLSAMEGKLLGMRRAVVQIGAANEFSRFAGEKQKEKMESLNVPTIIVTSEAEAIAALKRD